MITTVTINPSIDYLLYLPKPLTPGFTNRSRKETLLPGGKGINVSRILSELGFPSKAIGFLAGFTGKAIEEMLSGTEVIRDFLYLPEGLSRINVKIKAEESPDQVTETEINAQGPSIPKAYVDQLFDRLLTLDKGDTLVLAGNIPSCLPSDLYEQIFSLLSDRDLKIVCDASGELLLKVLPYHPFLIKPNEEELSGLFGETPFDEADILKKARILQEKGARNVLVSRGSKGAVLLSEHGEAYALFALPGKVINAVGAGDSMVAGFLAGYARTGDYRKALSLGTICGAATAFSEDLATKDLILSLQKQAGLSW